MDENYFAGSESGPYVTRAEVEQIINERLGSIKIYVCEADITEAQQGMRAIIEQAEF